jgi:hypothetical protein
MEAAARPKWRARNSVGAGETEAYYSREPDPPQRNVGGARPKKERGTEQERMGRLQLARKKERGTEREPAIKAPNNYNNLTAPFLLFPK